MSGGEAATTDLERAATRRAWQGQQLSAATRRRTRAVPSKATGRPVRLGGPAAVCSEAAGERIRGIGRGMSG
jgi:hypothetical protein